MRLTTAFLASLSLCVAALAQDDKPAQPPATPPAAVDAPAAQPPAPAAIPVPDGPVVEKKELEGGLIIEEIKIGEGAVVPERGAVVAHYHGTLKADPTVVFDSSFTRGTPIAFPLANVIQGWQKGVPGMKVGGVRKLTIPAAMAYGPTARPNIPANSDLVFVIQLMDTVSTEDLKVGEGEAAEGVFVAVLAFTIKDKDGKEIEKHDASKPYIWIPNECQGIQFGLEGMKVGGKRKIGVPKEMNTWIPQFAGNRTGNVPIEVEVEMLQLRVLQKPQN